MNQVLLNKALVKVALLHCAAEAAMLPPTSHKIRVHWPLILSRNVIST